MHAMTSKAIAGRWEGIEIPDHLLYHEPRAPHNAYAGVLPRYNSPPKRQAAPDTAPSRSPLHRSTNPHYAAVEPRYLSPPKSSASRSPRPDDEPALPKNVSLKMTPEYLAHKKHAAVFQHVPAKYFDIYTVSQSVGTKPASSKREEIEAKRRADRQRIAKEGKLFSVPIAQTDGTFGDPKEPPRKSKSGGHSVVMEWVRKGVPIPSQRPASPPATPRSSRHEAPFVCPGGAGGGSFFRRTTSPTRPAALQEEKILTAVQQRLAHPSKLSSEVAQRLQRPSPTRCRTTSPTRTPVRATTSPTTRTISPERGMVTSPALQRRQPAAMTNNISSRPSSATHRRGAPQTVEYRPPSNVVQRGPAATTRGGPLDISPISPRRTISPIRSVTRADDTVDIQISVVSDVSELTTDGCTPRTHPSSQQRTAAMFRSPPRLASP